MSNFICSECGMTNIDCGRAGYKTPKEIELEKKLEIATKALKGVCVWANTGNGGEQAVKKVCDKALKEMKGVK